MKPRHRLVLRREAMSELLTDELRDINAGQSPAPCWFIPTHGPSCRYCPSIPFTNCTILQETDSVTCETDVC